ncbi:lysine biosynthesis protein LysX [Pyrodictium abyssi]|uniref:Lysine biosynthesis protein LysX n=1 Tax=Pyrodictium abyssi TaxID=54256 RepID=A0ABM8ISI3_9CREN|nr:lysine biosynthesis protein LysX [Pyrodictium abyssi]
MLRVAVVVDVVRQEEQMLLKTLGEYMDARLFNVRSRALELGSDGLDAAVIRPISMYRAAYTAASFEAAGVFTVNQSETIMIAGDKLLAYARLAAARIPIPRSFYAADVEAALEAASKLGYPVVVKAPVGSWGRLVSRADSPEELEQLANMRQRLPCSQTRSMIVQEYLETGNSDIRCIVVAGTMLGCIRRIAQNGEWRSNVALGAKTEAYPANPALEDMVLRAAAAVKGFFVSIDVFETREKGYLVNEVNGVPEFKGFYRATGINPAKRLAEALLEELKR